MLPSQYISYYPVYVVKTGMAMLLSGLTEGFPAGAFQIDPVSLRALDPSRQWGRGEKKLPGQLVISFSSLDI